MIYFAKYLILVVIQTLDGEQKYQTMHSVSVLYYILQFPFIALNLTHL